MVQVYIIALGKRKKKERSKQRKDFVKEEKEKEKERRKEKKMEDFFAFRRSELDGPNTKVVIRSTIYMSTSKTWSFDKLYKVKNFPTRFTLNLKTIKWYGLFMGGHEI